MAGNLPARTGLWTLWQGGYDKNIWCPSGMQIYTSFDTEADGKAWLAERPYLTNDGRQYLYLLVQDDDPASPMWMKREAERFEYGHYITVPWHYEPWADDCRIKRFVHMSLKQPGMISFTENANKGALDRQAPATRAGRYLQRFYADVLTPTEIEQWSAKADLAGGHRAVKVTLDESEIILVYENGPNSCMSGNFVFDGHIHPSAVYAGPDLGVAYMGEMDNATSRAVVWVEKKLYFRVYGNETRMKQLLEDAGYRQGTHDEFVGARLRAIKDENGGGYIMPYVDMVGAAVLEEGHFVLSGVDGVDLHITCGTTEAVCRYSCDNCGEIVDEDDVVPVYFSERRHAGSDSWCQSCREEGAWFCYQTDRYYSDTIASAQFLRSVDHYPVTVLYSWASDNGVWVNDAEAFVEDAFTCDSCLKGFRDSDRREGAVGVERCPHCHDEYVAEIAAEAADDSRKCGTPIVPVIANHY
jgi:hypothetical protein